MRPSRVALSESGVSFERGIGVIRTQDDPLGQLAGNGISDARLGRIGVGVSAFARRFDHTLYRGDVVCRGGRVRRNSKRPGGWADKRFEFSAALEQCPMQTDIGLSKGRQPAAVGLRPRLRQRRCLPHGCERLLGGRRSGSRARQGHLLRGRQGGVRAQPAGCNDCQK